MSTTTMSGEQLFGYDVLDMDGHKIGTVDNVWLDDATSRPAFIGAKTGWLLTNTYVIPMENAQVDASNRAIRVPYREDFIKNAPNLRSDAELTAEEENTVYNYYGHQGSGMTARIGRQDYARSEATSSMPATGMNAT